MPRRSKVQEGAISFTRRVLGRGAADKLEHRAVVQTIRSGHDPLVRLALEDRIKRDEPIVIRLGMSQVGYALFKGAQPVRWSDLNVKDAKRGGFDSLEELERALKRAGFRFKPLDEYSLYRIRFSWTSQYARVTEIGTGLGICGAKVTDLSCGRVATTDANGFYSFDAPTTGIRIEAPGYPAVRSDEDGVRFEEPARRS